MSAQHGTTGLETASSMIPWNARLSLALFGPSIFGLRLFSTLAGAIMVVLAGLMARELGGGRFGMPRADVERYFASVEPAATIAMPYGVRNQEAGHEILVARQPRAPLDEVWPRLRTLD